MPCNHTLSSEDIVHTVIAKRYLQMLQLIQLKSNCYTVHADSKFLYKAHNTISTENAQQAINQHRYGDQVV